MGLEAQVTMFDGSPDTQFSLYPKPQREAIYAFQAQYGAVRVRKVEGSTDIEIEGLDGSQKRRVVASVYVGVDGCQR
jgi:hypothetical protein